MARPRRFGQHAATPARRQAILEAALACFTEDGIARVTVEQLCARAGCSVGSLYHHFGSKEGVAGALFLEALQDLNAGLIARLEGCTDAQAGVRAVVEHYADWVEAHPAWARFLIDYREIQFTEDDRRTLRAVYEQHFGAVFSWFATFVERGTMKNLPPETYIPLISAPIEDYTRMWLSGRTKTPPAAVKAVFAEAAWAAVAAPAN
jgi:AcrR family transcriptional regulator